MRAAIYALFPLIISGEISGEVAWPIDGKSKYHSMDSTIMRTSVLRAAWSYWADLAARSGRAVATRDLFARLWEFVRDSTPARLRQRYGDADYDWDHRVNTTSAAVGWRERLLGVLSSPYQPTEPALFHEMLAALAREANFDFRDFTFVDLGSGKGRSLLMASDYPFRRIIGVELIPALHRIAQENLRKYKSESQRCFQIESICADATGFAFSGPQFHDERFRDQPLVLYLFNPFPEAGLRRVIENLERSLLEQPQPEQPKLEQPKRKHARRVYVLYHNPLLEHVLAESATLRKIGGTHQYSVFSSEY
jgi:hypothetical protein